uniref:PNPLA domain-containing protein n=1 Tax=Xenopus tropicalis TaxID=8364 RepID=A0A6I8Q1L5_XENTR
MSKPTETKCVPQSLSFSGSGFLSVYQMGAVNALWDLAPELLHSAPKVYGASGGSIVAAAVVLRLNIGKGFSKTIVEAAKDASKSVLGPLLSKFNLVTILQNALQHILPDNAHEEATGRLYVGVTRLSDGKNIMISDYKSKEEVIQALICSCFVPIYCGLVPPSFRGVRYIDGGLSGFQPRYGKTSMITVSPFSGEIDICPRDSPLCHLCLHVCNTSFQLTAGNLSRISYALFPPPIWVMLEIEWKLEMFHWAWGRRFTEE